MALLVLALSRLRKNALSSRQRASLLLLRAISLIALLFLAAIALTDGAANENSDNNRALSALTESGVPFIGVGFGSDQGISTLSLRSVEAPATVSPKTAFSISAQLELLNADEVAPFDLVL